MNGAGGAQAAADGADDDSDVSLDVDEVSVASECTTVSLRALRDYFLTSSSIFVFCG